jgi:hypothetical protein
VVKTFTELKDLQNLILKYKQSSKITKYIDLDKIEKSFQIIINTIEIIRNYLLDRSQSKSTVLFSDNQEPSIELIGACVELNGGHTKEFNFREESCLNAHLMAAGFGDVETSNFLQEVALDESRLNVRESTD